MKSFLSFVTFLILFLSAPAQSTWQWVSHGTNTSDSWGIEIATDPMGNSYISGTFNDTLLLGNTTLISKGNSDIFIAKYDPLGQLLWAKSAGGSGQDLGAGIAIDRLGNVFVESTFTDTAFFESDTLISNGSSDICLAKYASNGSLIWTKYWGSVYEDLAGKMYVDKYDNLYLTGDFAEDGNSPPLNGTINFGAATLTSNGNGDIFIVKADTSGNVIWAKHAGGKFSDGGGNVVADTSGNVYVTGIFDAPWADFDTVRLYNKVGPFHDMFIAKYDSSGNVLWAKGAGGDKPASGNGVVVDKLGHVYVTGSSFQAAYIKFDNNIMLSGDESFIAKYGSDGTIIWAKDIADTGNDIAQAMAIDKMGNLYVTGHYNNLSYWASDTLHSAGLSDIFVTAYDSSGNLIFAKSAGGTANDGAYGLALDNFGNILATGYVQSQPAIFDALQVSAASGWNPFVAKLSNPLAVNDIHLQTDNIHVYPNPADDILNVISDDNTISVVQLFNVIGRTVLSQSLTGKKTYISTKELPAGLYYLRLSTKTNTITKKILINH